jgi:hypothetical protein
MSFDTTHMSFPGEDSDSTSSDDTATGDSLALTSSEFDTQSGSESSFRPHRAVPGSPWRDPVHLDEDGKAEDRRVDPQVLGQSLREISRRRLRSRGERTPRPTDDEEQPDGNALYVKGTQEVPLESRIESE